MFYVVVKDKGSDNAKVCFCSASDIAEAKRMTGLSESSDDWITLTEDQVRTVLATKEGYIAKDL